MKNLILTVFVAFAAIFSLNAQTMFGAKAGFVSANSKVEADGLSMTNSESGFAVGLFAEFELSETIDLAPELLYTSVDETSILQLPIMAKFNIGENFNILAGPQITYILEEQIDDFTNFSIGLGAGVAYDFSDNLFIDAKYTLQLTNTYTGSADATAKIHFLNIGLGYRFN
tara:strand:+ start:37972 stop:38484 length:513 start_codon:yes stop_codon:yes gene_type:complete